MVSTDDILKIGVLGLSVGVAMKAFKFASKPLKKSKKKRMVLKPKALLTLIILIII